jgi:hypothetical protein
MASNVDLSKTHETYVKDDYLVYNVATGVWDTVPTEVNEPLYAKTGATSAWGYCETCQESFLLGQMAKIGGKYYCYKNGDARDELARRKGE